MKRSFTHGEELAIESSALLDKSFDHSSVTPSGGDVGGGLTVTLILEIRICSGGEELYRGVRMVGCHQHHQRSNATCDIRPGANMRAVWIRTGRNESGDAR